MLRVADMEDEIIRYYDPLGTNRGSVMSFILLYLYDSMCHMEEDRGGNKLRYGCLDFH